VELAGKRIALLGGTFISCEIVKAAHDLGMEVHVLDYNPPSESPAKLIADAHAQISIADADAVASYVRDNGIDGLMTGYTDSILGFYARACDAAGLPCYGTKEQFDTFTDKRKWKELCAKYRVPTARQYEVGDAEDRLEDVCYPVLVKPADGSGSRGVSVVREAGEFGPALNRAREFSKCGEVVVEDYLEGPEVTVFWLFVNGVKRVFMLGNRVVKDSQGGAMPLPVGYTFPASVLPRYLDEVAPHVDEMLESQGVRNGMMFMQCIVRDGIPHVYDIGYRLTGSLEHYLTKEVAGYSPVDMLLHYAVTGKMTDDSAIWDKVERVLYAPCYNVSFLMKPGTIASFRGLDKLASIPSVVAVVKAHVEGETLPEEALGELRQIALRVLGVTDGISALRSEIMNVQSTLDIIGDDDESLVLPGFAEHECTANVIERNRYFSIF